MRWRFDTREHGELDVAETWAELRVFDGEIQRVELVPLLRPISNDDVELNDTWREPVLRRSGQVEHREPHGAVESQMVEVRGWVG